MWVGIGEELRKKKPEHFVDERSIADLHASLERAAWVLEQKTAKGERAEPSTARGFACTLCGSASF